jgi:hypothetical protein
MWATCGREVKGKMAEEQVEDDDGERRRLTRISIRFVAACSAPGVEASLAATGGWVLSSTLGIAYSGVVWYDGA